MSTALSSARRSARPLVFALALAMILTVSLWALPARADTPLPDGLSQATAAGSCWEVKQNTPSAPSGVYWLLTPALQAPQQFYCDQETDGGGWVLVGRGRQGWRAGYQGKDPQQVHTVVDGVGAFSPAQLPATTIDGLLNNGRVDALADGVRLRRASNTAGTAWQEVRYTLANNGSWVWAYGSEMPVASFTFGAGTGSGGTIRSFGQDNRFRRVQTNELANQNYLWGFAFGPQVAGSPASTSYLWSSSNGLGNARPFTQVYLRPTLALADMDFGTIPDTGTPVQEQTPLAESGALPTTWAVSGFANGRAGELNTEVAAFGEVADRVFVGGNFRYVQRNQAGLDQTEQSYLAAFDKNTGEFIPTFSPTLDGQVKAIMGLPDGRLAVGGQFSTVNGVARPALAFLDPITGDLSGWQVLAENRATGATPYIRGLDVQDNWLYVAGAMTHLTSDGTSWSASTWNGGRINLADGEADINWNAFLNGTTVDVDASADGDRAYFSGYFRNKESTFVPSGTALLTTAGAPLTSPLWSPTFSRPRNDANGIPTGNIWQLGVQEAGGQVWLGGSEHSLFSYDTDTFTWQDGSITKAGGDIQNVDLGGTSSYPVIYAGCHCGDWVYQTADTWPTVTGFDEVNEITLIGAWDATGGKYLPEFSPVLTARAGYGAWASFQDSNGVLWVGGDFLRSVRTNGSPQWSGGFVRFAARDTQAPTTPTALEANTGPDGVTLSWGGSTDDRAGVSYEVIRDDRVIGTTMSLSMTVPNSEETHRYFVRAIDAAENRSASTAAVVVEPAPEFVELVAAGSQWSWRYSGDALPDGWNEPGFDVSSWSSGPAILGV
ncbi:MAG: fibrinogen-like YCDxxxxGGGW domain-containing protein, partial [Beutenbergiaceae bacterium]